MSRKRGQEPIQIDKVIVHLHGMNEDEARSLTDLTVQNLARGPGLVPERAHHAAPPSAHITAAKGASQATLAGQVALNVWQRSRARSQ